MLDFICDNYLFINVNLKNKVQNIQRIYIIYKT